MNRVVVYLLHRGQKNRTNLPTGVEGEFQLTNFIYLFFKMQHEQYNVGSASYANDIAILTFATTISVGGNVALATLPPNNNDQFAGANCVITGWGRNCKQPFFRFYDVVINER
jgi:Trypsin